ncbi:31562_t:CDS:2, partial [Racocetra persica]
KDTNSAIATHKITNVTNSKNNNLTVEEDNRIIIKKDNSDAIDEDNSFAFDDKDIDFTFDNIFNEFKITQNILELTTDNNASMFVVEHELQ